MTMTDGRASLSRRTALGGLGAGALGLALATREFSVSAQATPDSRAQHPLTGMWLAMANPPLPDDPQIAVPSVFAVDGSVLLVFPLTQAGPQGVQFNSANVGMWEPFDARTGHFTAVQVLSDADGAFLGTVTVDGYPVVSEDGQTFIDDGSLAMATIRDPTGEIVETVSGVGSRPVTAIRMGVGAPREYRPHPAW